MNKTVRKRKITIPTLTLALTFLAFCVNLLLEICNSEIMLMYTVYTSSANSPIGLRQPSRTPSQMHHYVFMTQSLHVLLTRPQNR